MMSFIISYFAGGVKFSNTFFFQCPKDKTYMYSMLTKQHMWDKKAQTHLTLMHFSQAKWFDGCGLFKNT